MLNYGVQFVHFAYSKIGAWQCGGGGGMEGSGRFIISVSSHQGEARNIASPHRAL